MKDTIVQGLAQAYGNLVHMIADFLPRFLVMLIIILGVWLRIAVKRFSGRSCISPSWTAYRNKLALLTYFGKPPCPRCPNF